MMKYCKLVFFFSVFTLLSGCGSEEDIRLVQGVVTYQNAPLAGATITFVPVDKDGVMATGLTETDGSYRLTSFGSKKKGSGARIGSYRVSIVKREEPAVSDDVQAVQKSETTWEEIRRNQASEQNTAQARQSQAGPPRSLPPPVSLIPLKYASGETSGLTATVEDKGLNIHNFQPVD
ncbi:MAG: carboxypeptidase-like regulatory domain-containing protein [Planctomycetaceae bacterium]|nr:carboxypeptidase-like regulatory domain-containing protein [Planctomycetaceae bacterium]